MPNMKSLQKLGMFSPKKGKLANRCHKQLSYQRNRFFRSLVRVTTLGPARKSPKIEILIQSSAKAFDLSKCPEVSRAIFWGSEFLLELGRPSVRDMGKDILTWGQSLGSRSLGSRPAVILSCEESGGEGGPYSEWNIIPAIPAVSARAKAEFIFLSSTSALWKFCLWE